MASRRGRALKPSTWSLRARLLAALIGLLVAVCIVIGTVTTFVLKDFLYDQKAGVVTAVGQVQLDLGAAAPSTAEQRSYSWRTSEQPFWPN